MVLDHDDRIDELESTLDKLIGALKAGAIIVGGLSALSSAVTIARFVTGH